MKHGKYIALLFLVLSLGALIYLRLDDRPSQNIKNPESSFPVESTDVSVIHTTPEELEAVMTAEELEKLDASSLKRLDLTGSTCYDAIEKFQSQHRNVEVIYSIILNGDGDPLYLDPETETLNLEDASYLPSLTENVSWLSRLRSVSLSPDAADAAEVDALHDALQ